MLRFLSLAFVASQLAALAVVQSVGAGVAKSAAFAARSSDRFSLDDDGDEFEFDLDIASKQKLKTVQQRFDGDEAIEVVTSATGDVSSSSDFSTKVRPSGMNYGRGTRFVTTQTVLKGEVLFTVPFRDVISLESARQGRIKALMDANPDMPASIILAAHLLEERFLGESSRFYEYIQKLPSSRSINSTTFYSEQDLQQLQGSHLFRLTHARNQGMANYFDALVGPITSRAVDPPLFTAAQFTKENFDWAMATVWARAFSLTENENEAVIAPILDTIGLCLDSDCPENDIQLDQKGRRIVVYASQDYAKGEEVLMSLGIAKPTSLLMMNHGMARAKPYTAVETMEVSIFLDPNDPLVSIKTHLLESHNMTINGSYVLRYQGDQLDAQLIRSLKTKLLTASELDKHQQLTENDDNDEAYPIVSLRNEFVFTRALVMTCKNLLAQYPTTLAQDKAQLDRLGRDRLNDKKVHILRALVTEKEILQHTMDAALKQWSDLLLVEDVAKLI